MARLPKIACIGAGNLASHIIPALRKHRYEITQVYSRNMNNAKALASITGGTAINKIRKLTCDADIYMIMVPDENITECSAIIDDACGSKDIIITHSSGATSLKSIASEKSNFGVFYPLQSFKKDEKVDLKTVPFLIEASNKNTSKKLLTIARKLSRKAVMCNSDDRIVYHLSAVLVNNFVTHLHSKNRELLKKEKLDPELLSAIISQTSEKLLKIDAIDLQTGPAKRGDKHTMRKHLDIIKQDKLLTEIYKLISKSIKHFHKDL